MTRGLTACLAALLVGLGACGGDGGAGTGGGSSGAVGGGGSTSDGIHHDQQHGLSRLRRGPLGLCLLRGGERRLRAGVSDGLSRGVRLRDPGDSPEGQFDCAGVLLCTVAEACVVVAGESACPEHFCEPLPPPCVGQPKCDCLAEFLDSDLTTKACVDAPGGPRVDLAALGLVWDPPFCDGVVCEEPEICWSCVDGSGITFACSEDDPLAGNLCTPAR